MNKNNSKKNRINFKILKKRAKSKSIKKLLLPIEKETSQKVISYAINFAIQTDAKLFGVYAIPILPAFENSYVPEYHKFMLKKANEMFQDIQKKCDRLGVSFSYKVLYGKPGQRIVEFSKKHSFDGIIMGTGNKGKIAQLFLGSTTNYVTHKSKIPVTIVR